MKNTKIALSKLARSQRLKSLRTSAALLLTTLMLLIAAATTAATAQTYTDLFNFAGQCESAGCGVVFKITPSGKLKVLYKFDGGTDGGQLYSGLTLGTGGDFYGTTAYNGDASCLPPAGCGTVFKITRSGSLTTLYRFTNSASGAVPLAPPIEGNDGDFYGTTGYGTAYKITSSGTYTSLGYTTGESAAPLLQGADGNFYGTTSIGGKNPEDGTVFKMTPKGKLTIVFNFDGTHGAYPYYGALIQGSDGNFYGTTYAGGSYGQGVVFKVTPQAALTVLHNFPDPDYPNDGSGPMAGLVQATDGNFYGTTVEGGTCCGVIFQITSTGAYSILYNFDAFHGASPESTPMQHTNGKIYGLATGGGTYGQFGVVYSFDMGLAPFVSLVSTTGKIGKTVEILGQGFAGTTGVSFNGTAATFTVKSDTYLTAAVPAGATTGVVTVTTPSGTLTSNKPFRVGPLILSFTPTSGPVGTSVTITGSGLTQTNKVAFGGVLATNFTVNSDTQVTATVPTGAKTGHIGIITVGGQTWSSATFTVTQ